VYRTGELEKANGRVGKTPRAWPQAESRDMSTCIRTLLAVRRGHGTDVASKPPSSRAKARGSEILQDQDQPSMPDLQDLLPSCPNRVGVHA
jgi:hypothetical protein